MRDQFFGPDAPHMRAEVEPDGALRVAAYAILLTLAAALILVGWLCL